MVAASVETVGVPRPVILLVPIARAPDIVEPDFRTTVSEKLPWSAIAAAISSKVSKVPGAPAIRLVIEVSTYALVEASVDKVGVARSVIFCEFIENEVVGTAKSVTLEVRTCVSKLETVDASCVPVWLARAKGSVASLPLAIEPANIVLVTVPVSAAVIAVPAILVAVIAAAALMSASTIAPAVILEFKATFVLPSKEIAVAVTSPVIEKFLAVKRETAVEALPVKLPVTFAVIVPAPKLPEASRETIAEPALEAVAVVAVF